MDHINKISGGLFFAVTIAINIPNAIKGTLNISVDAAAVFALSIFENKFLELDVLMAVVNSFGCALKN